MFERLDYIIAIAEEQNITKAAKRLYISQPALTKYLNKLESDYGVSLFDRSSSPIVLTEAGRLFLSEKIRIETAEQNLRHRLELMKSKRLRLSIGIGHSRAQAWIPPLLREFCSLYPDIDIEITGAGELSLLKELQQDHFDLVVGAFDPWEPNLEYRYLTEEKLRLLIPLRFGILPEEISPERTIDEPHILDPTLLDGLNYVSPSKEMGSYDSYQILRQKYSIRLGRLITINNARALRDIVLSGLGYTYCTVGSPANLMDSAGNYVAACALLPGLPTLRRTAAAYKNTNPKSELLCAIVDILERRHKSPHSAL